MIGALIGYGAVATKVKAMYANRLTAEDFAKIAKLRRMPDVVAFLKEHPSWRGAFDGSFDETRRGPLEAGLRRHLMSEYLRILHFLGREDRFIVYDRVLRIEMEQIMLFLRYARAGRASDYRPELPAFFERHSRIHYDALSKAQTHADMLTAVKDTGFYTSLARLPLEDGGFPDYTSVEMVMRNHYYRALMDLIGKRYRGRDRELLRRAVGQQADMINITIILRVRKFFPGKLDSVIALLLPVQYRLTPAFVNRLYSAATGEQASALLRESPYKKIFIAHDYAHIEDYYYQFLYDFNRRLLALGLPSVYTPAAYLSLREIELKNLTTAIECVRYGLQPSEAPTYLFGVPL